MKKTIVVIASGIITFFLIGIVVFSNANQRIIMTDENYMDANIATDSVKLYEDKYRYSEVKGVIVKNDSNLYTADDLGIAYPELLAEKMLTQEEDEKLFSF